MKTSPEQDLLRRVCENDREAFTILYKQYVPPLYQYVYFISHSNEVSEEIVQEVFVRLWEQRTSLVDITSFKAYIFRCAKNMLLDHIKRQKHFQSKVLSVVAREAMEQQAVQDGAAEDHKKEIIRHAIDRLPARRKEIVKLRINDNFSIREIARHLSISGSVVKKQLYAGLTFIKEYVSRYDDTVTILILILAYIQKKF